MELPNARLQATCSHKKVTEGPGRHCSCESLQELNQESRDHTRIGVFGEFDGQTWTIPAPGVDQKCSSQGLKFSMVPTHSICKKKKKTFIEMYGIRTWTVMDSTSQEQKETNPPPVCWDSKYSRKDQLTQLAGIAG